MFSRHPTLTLRDLRWWLIGAMALGYLIGAFAASFVLGPVGLRSVLMALAFTGSALAGLLLLTDRPSTRVKAASRFGLLLGLAGVEWAVGRDGAAVVGVLIAVAVGLGTLIGPAIAARLRRRFGR